MGSLARIWECSKSSGIVRVQKRTAWAVWLLRFNIHQWSPIFASRWNGPSLFTNSDGRRHMITTWQYTEEHAEQKWDTGKHGITEERSTEQRNNFQLYRKWNALNFAIMARAIGIQRHPADSSGFINVEYFLESNFSPSITLQKTISCATPEILGYARRRGLVSRSIERPLRSQNGVYQRVGGLSM